LGSPASQHTAAHACLTLVLPSIQQLVDNISAAIHAQHPT
jgi:hypothetical protein